MRDPNMGTAVYEYNTNTIQIKDPPYFDGIEYDLDNEKELVKYLKYVERVVRGSYEYKELIKYLKSNFYMNTSSFMDLSIDDLPKVKIEIHHDPLALYDICAIVLRKRRFYNESTDPEMTAQEVMLRHYNKMVGLIPLTTTEHQLVHNNFLFIPTNKVFGSYKEFVNLYKDFILPEELEILEEIEKATNTYTNDDAEKIFNSSYVYIDTGKQLPPINELKQVMQARIDALNTPKKLKVLYRKIDPNTDEISIA